MHVQKVVPSLTAAHGGIHLTAGPIALILGAIVILLLAAAFATHNQRKSSRNDDTPGEIDR
jgi:hypothetical protein